MKRPIKEELAYRQEHIDNWRSQGISMREYCEQTGIKFNCFKHWCYGKKKENNIVSSTKEDVGKFISVKEKIEGTPPTLRENIPSILPAARFELSLLFGLIVLRVR